jgi:hypothetical protein
MDTRKIENDMANVDVSEVNNEGPGLGSRIAPAVALLLLGDTAYAGAVDDDNPTVVSEPETLALMAVGAVIGGAVKYIHNKRRKK